jgi:hypothetical protein
VDTEGAARLDEDDDFLEGVETAAVAVAFDVAEVRLEDELGTGAGEALQIIQVRITVTSANPLMKASRRRRTLML